MDLVSGALLRLAGAVLLVGVFGYGSLKSAEFVDTIGKTGMAGGIPMWVPLLAVPVGFGLMMVGTVPRLVVPAQAQA